MQAWVHIHTLEHTHMHTVHRLFTFTCYHVGALQKIPYAIEVEHGES